MYLPLDPPTQISYDMDPSTEMWVDPPSNLSNENSANTSEDIARKLKSYLRLAGVPSIDENLLLQGLLADNTLLRTNHIDNMSNLNNTNVPNNKPQLYLGQSEFDFIEAYNALTRSSPLPNINNTLNDLQTNRENVPLSPANISLTHKQSSPVNNLQNKTEHTNIQAQRRPVEPIERTDIREEQTINATVKMPKASQNSTTVENEKKLTSNSSVAIEHESKPIKKLLSTRQQKNKVPQTEEVEPRPLNAVDTKTQSEQEIKEERSSNLSDIVDNTQRLIQQMKAEINSDINSLDGHNMSQSEADNSSNESDFSSEHESSHSESEAETEDLTSEENENSSDEGEQHEQSVKSATAMNRTSSEEYEQFEEAMDHIEEQNENFRQTNMEILDSIARSLQEHPVAIEVNKNHIEEAVHDPGTAIDLAPMILPTNPDQKNQGTISENRKQDLNNNLFAAVSSFEEIYEQISSKNPPPPEKSIKNKNKQSEPKPVVLERHEVQISTFEPVVIMKLEVTEKQQPTLNAVLEIFEIDTNLSNNDEEIKEPHQQVVNHNIETESTITPNTVNIQDSPDNIENVDNDESDGSSSDTSRTTISPMKQNPIQNLNSDQTFNNGNKDETAAITPINISVNNQNHDLDHNVEGGAGSSGVKSKSNSPDKTPQNSENDNQSTANSKSNIPKLIKASSNKNKSKLEIKTSPKVIASKVPVRRGSLKNYAAPAPPKTNFGTIQNGTVKQLQTRLFNNKAIKMTVNPAAVFEVKPSTSTLNKKRPAPLPPSKADENKESSPTKESPRKEKKPYFRESCRTEDEWTESDSEESSLQIVRQNSDEPQRQPSPPPPITVRKVSGQLIDLARVRILEGSPEVNPLLQYCLKFNPSQ